MRTPLIFRAAARNFAVHEVLVPSLGDSITDGTLVEFTKGPGEAIAADDIVAVIETDKVSVDIRSPVAGTVTSHLVREDDTVVVGQGVLTLDSDVEATVKIGAPAAVAEPAVVPTTATTPVSVPAPASSPAVVSLAAPVSPSKRVIRCPRITFRHGDREAIARTRHEVFDEVAVYFPDFDGASNFDAQFLALPALYARLPISEEEMLAIELGGAVD